MSAWNCNSALATDQNLVYLSLTVKTRLSFRISGWPVVRALALLGSVLGASSAENVILTDVPDYTWYAGCFGTASGNLMGYWDRHGFPQFYTGPTADGVAPLNSNGPNQGIRSMWASKAGLDGRPADQFGHIDDYWLFYRDDVAFSYESTAPDPYVTAGRPEHTPDCVGDFIGLSQNKWTNLDGECDGNIDAFSFVFWDKSGGKRINYVPKSSSGQTIPDIPSGLRAWTQFRGSDAEVFSQLADFNPTLSPGQGFSFADLKAEIDAGYPVLIYLQDSAQLFRSLPGMERANPEIHGMLATGYYVDDNGVQRVRYKTSWGSSGDNRFALWSSVYWEAQLPVRGFIGYHPLPQITKLTPLGNNVTIEWDGPSSALMDLSTHTSTLVHWYILEKATHLDPPDFEPVSDPTTERSVTLNNCCPEKAAFYRLKLLPPSSAVGQP